MKLTGEVALAYAWTKLGNAAPRAPDPDRYARLAARSAAEIDAAAYEAMAGGLAR